jgi:hypothetical protein
MIRDTAMNEIAYYTVLFILDGLTRQGLITGAESCEARAKSAERYMIKVNIGK